jgi:hypothetical protein
VHQAFRVTKGECNHRKGAKAQWNAEIEFRIWNLGSGIWILGFRDFRISDVHQSFRVTKAEMQSLPGREGMQAD